MTTEANDTVDTPETITPETETPEVPEVKNPAGLAQKNRELLAKNADLTARVAELEAQANQHATDMAALQADFDTFHIRRPLARLAEEISPLPDLWQAEFLKHYDLKPEGDDLAIFTKKGKRCVVPEGYTRSGEPFKFNAKSIWEMLAYLVPDKKAPEVARWHALMRYFGPSGGGASGLSGSRATTEPAPEAPAPRPPLGLR